MSNINTTSRRTRRAVALIAFPGALLAASAGAALSAPAAADPAYPGESGDVHTMSCPQSATDKDKEGYGHVKGDWLRYRTGPSTGCAALGQAAGGTKIYYHCFVGDYPNSWTHGRIAGTQEQGWFFDALLTDAGSRVRC